MSYEDLEEARAKRAEKDKATAGKVKGKHGRKRKSPAPEAGSLGAEAGSLGAKAVSSVPKNKVARMSEMLEPARAPTAPWRATVARMY
jgi:hypothetical protein